MDSKILNPKFEIEIIVLACEILIFGGQSSNRNFGKIEISKFGRTLVPFRLQIFDFSRSFLFLGPV